MAALQEAPTMKPHVRRQPDGPLKVHANHGLFKRCDHGRTKWKDCPCPWYANFAFRGQAHRVSLAKWARKAPSYRMLKTEADTLATTWRAEIVAQTNNPTTVLSGHVETFAALCDVYLKTVRSSGRRARARVVIERHVERLREAFPVAVTAITPQAVDNWRNAFVARVDEQQQQVNDSREQQGLKESQFWRKGGQVMANRLLARLSHILRWAINAGHIAQHPYLQPDGRAAVKLVKEVPRDRRLEGDEEARLMAHAGAHLQDVIVCCLATAMRIGEVSALQWRHVALDGPRPAIRIPSALTKTSVQRNIPIRKALVPILERRRVAADGKTMTPTDYVFGTETGEAIASVRTAWNATLRRAGIEDLHVHDLRRESASRMHEAGATLKDVMVWLGHKRIETTARYLGTLPDRLHEVAQRMDDVLAQTLPTTTDTATITRQAAQRGHAVSI
jgi:integrase